MLHTRAMPSVLAAAMLLVATSGPAAADPAAADIDCRCRAAGQSYELGAVVCLKMANGARLARCDMAQNVTSWTFLSDGCPLASALEMTPIEPDDPAVQTNKPPTTDQPG
ncbi:MAG: hypothetical protein QNJ92_15100 [Alphaproteobacteria bacterium]|nr:hypothetical protein [Alphaproteobacteria bacterium]